MTNDSVASVNRSSVSKVRPVNKFYYPHQNPR